MWVFVCVCIRVFVCVQAYTCMYACVCTRVDVCVCVRARVCILVCARLTCICPEIHPASDVFVLADLLMDKRGWGNTA